MRFRRIYWVTESVGENGSEVTGVFTSVHDLLEAGLPMHEGEYRVGLFELDSTRKCLLSVGSSAAFGVSEQLTPFIESGELTHEEACRLASALEKQ